MVRIRLRRLGTKGRPFYRIVVAESKAGRNGVFVETIGTYDPTRAVKVLEVKEDRALHWLMNGAQPTETVAYILNKTGVLPKFLEQRPSQRKAYSFLDKRTAATSVASAVDTVAVATAPEPKPEPEPEPVAAAVEPTPEPAPEPESAPEPTVEAAAPETAEPETTPAE